MLTVGELRRLIEGIPDAKLVCLEWFGGPPGDYDPSVQLHGARRCNPDDDMACGVKRHKVKGSHNDGIELLISLVSLHDLDDDEDICEECDCVIPSSPDELAGRSCRYHDPSCSLYDPNRD